MQEVSHDSSSRYTEGDLRLHAAIRAVLSPGVWLVLAAQIGLMFSMQWRLPADASPVSSALLIGLTAGALLLFFYLQAGAFHALTLKREALSVGEILAAGKPVFTAFVWLTIKAGLLFALVMNGLVLVVLLLTGADFKTFMRELAAFFGPATGVVAFVFVYWLPFVFVQREFRLLPSLKASLRLAWNRMPHSAFLALLVLAPAVAIGFLPAEGPVLLDVMATLASGILGWIAYIYCVDVQQQGSARVTAEAAL